MYRLVAVDDDNAFLARMIRYMDWKALGIEVAGHAQNGREAWEICQQVQPDILLTDVRMPYMGGIELACRVHERFDLCQIIFMSVYSEKSDLKMAIRVRAIDYIEKPLDIASLSEALGHAMEILGETRRTQPGDNGYSRSVGDVIQYMLFHYSQDITIDFLASQVYLSPNHLSGVFKTETGKTINQYLTDIRMEQAKTALRGSRKSVAEIAASVGYSDERYFSRLFAKTTGMTPSQFRR